ncbi:MAG: hypothetical protein AAF206_02165 [Bacteroidota bacterium]
MKNRNPKSSVPLDQVYSFSPSISTNRAAYWLLGIIVCGVALFSTFVRFNLKLHAGDINIFAAIPFLLSGSLLGFFVWYWLRNFRSIHIDQNGIALTSLFSYQLYNWEDMQQLKIYEEHIFEFSLILFTGYKWGNMQKLRTDLIVIHLREGRKRSIVADFYRDKEGMREVLKNFRTLISS